jgi:hypothetical protein
MDTLMLNLMAFLAAQPENALKQALIYVGA